MSARAFAEGFLRYVDASPTAFHAVHETREKLIAAGFVALKEGEPWTLTRGKSYYFTRNQSTIVAFTVGGAYKPGNGFRIIAGHTDSPHFKVKPVSLTKEKQGYNMLGVECYGGGVWHSWFDRDLTLAGRVVVAEGEKLSQRLVHIRRPIMRIPTLAIHLDRGVNDAFTFNKEDQLRPIFSTQIKSALEGHTSTEGQHHPAIVSALAKELECRTEDIRDFELGVVDTQPSTIGGVHDEFIFAPRLDNLMSCYVCLESLLAANQESSIEEEDSIRVIAFFDHEEIGSSSAQGAASSLLRHFMTRVTACMAPSDAPPDIQDMAIRKSYLVSMDMAHAIHPCYPSKHEEHHAPHMHKGFVIKTNQNQRYATNVVTATIFREIARRAGQPIQEFVVRNDTACGSTIGPILAANCGMRTIDVGIPQLSMHSVREQCGIDDVHSSFTILKTFFGQFKQIDDSIAIGE